MPEKIITYLGQKAKVACDGKCNKAWGIPGRPFKEVSHKPDDIVFLSDQELGEAPFDPGTYEGGHGKPENVSEFPNKWCVRACERCVMSNPGEFNLPLALDNWDERVYNIPRQ